MSDVIPQAAQFRVLNSTLKHLAYWYEQDNVEEVAVDCPGEIWLRLRGKRAHPWHCQPDPNLTRDYLTDIMYIIANTYELPFDPGEGTPLVFAALPGGHRFSGISGRNVMYDSNDLTGGIAMCIRVYSENLKIDLKDYELRQGERLRVVNPNKHIEVPRDPYERLLFSLRRGDHILVSGATATGKTTFLNNLLKIIDMHKRVLTIEDTRELIVPHKNRVHVVLSRTEQTNSLSYSKVIDLVVRFTPDAIIGGEISTSNAGALWELMGSGHDNCLATIHAENSEQAYQAFVDRILHSYPTTDVTKTLAKMREKIRVVQINRDGNIRAVTEVT